MEIEKLKSRFIQIFGASDESIHVYYSPGRVNLIGEHTDYNNGFVLPCALTFGTHLLVRKSDKAAINFKSENFDYFDEIPLDQLTKPRPGRWMNYPMGVFDQLIKNGFEPGGLELYYAGNIPGGAGLSSSASVEMVTVFAINDLYQLGLKMLDLIKISQKAENEFVGMQCGIMDQFAVGMGKAGHALFLDCGTLDYESVPLKTDGYKIVIANTNKAHKLEDSKYNQRVAECAQAVEFLSKAKPIDSLSDLSYLEFTEMKHHIPDITIRKRAKHVLSENQRVLDAVKVLRENKLRIFGKLMNASHNSLRYDYEVTGYELDTMVEESRRQPGVLGARMTGGGFGGSAIALVEESQVENFIRKVGVGFNKKTGLDPEFFISEAGDGTQKIESI